MQLYTISSRTARSSKCIAAILLLSINLIPTTPVFADFGQGAPTIPNAQPFGIDKQTAKVDSSTGAFTQHIALDIPPGRNGLQPNLALDYNSQRTQDSIVGYGWQLSIPYVQRLNKTGSQNLYSGTTLYYTSSLDGELANINTSPLPAATTSPSILDTPPLTVYQTSPGTTQDSRSYTVPSAGSNKLFLVFVANFASSNAPSATLNGQPVTFIRFNGTANRAAYFVGYLTNPTSGTFTINWSPSTNADYTLLTVKDAAQTNPLDAATVTTVTAGITVTTSVTTTQGSDLLLSFPVGSTASPAFSGFGTGEIQTIPSQMQYDPVTGSYKNAASTAGTETMTINSSVSQDIDEPVVAIKQFTGGSSLSANTFKARVDDGTSLAYGPGIDGRRSLLTSLQEQGYDENNTLTTLPATTFASASVDKLDLARAPTLVEE
jgi:hypothetical protein